ncbi:MAG: hypothetical protein E6K32_13370 [Gammaproteobacteria bacterium]|nr:MAG: hypothetical protein E6K32_13370 [Gammaproteobacteria bacterium]
MAMRAAAPIGWLAAALMGAEAAAVEPPLPSPTPAAVGDQRLVFSTNGSTLTGGSGGGGASAGWVGSVGADVVLGAGAEYQQIANAHWTTGNFSGSIGFEGGRTHLYVDAHEGAGDIGDHAFHYSLGSLGLLGQLTPELTLQLEERYIDIDTSHGSLPKLGLTYRMTLQLSATASYAKSVGGNLGTRLVMGRVDYTGVGFNALAGLAGGPAAPAVIFPGLHVVKPGPQLREGFVGIGKPFGRTEWLLLGDYQDVGGTRRTSITVNCTVHLRAPAQAP